MKGSKETLAKYLTTNYENNMRNKKQLRNITDYMIAEGFPLLEVTDVIQLRKQAIDCSDRMLYYLLKVSNAKLIPNYFSDREVKEYETTKYVPEKFSFPIKWNMIEITEGNQWIGKITVKELMKLRDAQLINYNERTQRTLRRVVNKDFEYYQIYLNRNAVDAITESYLKDQYIPNTITLNLPEVAEFTYSDGILTIKETEHLDIIDGYHRYVAMSNIYNQNPNFNYTMELRVVCFSEETAKQFIWQEDQKTKMRKLDSDSFNQNSPANQVVNMINQINLLRNVISRNEGTIDLGVATNLIDKIWFNTHKTVTRKEMIQTKDKIATRLNALLDSDPTIFDERWSYEFTVIAFTLMGNESITNKALLKEIRKLNKLVNSKDEYKTMLGRKGLPITTKIITRVNKLYAE